MTNQRLFFPTNSRDRYRMRRIRNRIPVPAPGFYRWLLIVCGVIAVIAYGILVTVAQNRDAANAPRPTPAQTVYDDCNF